MTGLEISGILLGALTLISAAVAPSLVSSIRSLADSLRGHAQGTLFQNTSLHLIDVIESVVLSAEHEIEVKLKDASSDGVITAAEIDDIVLSVIEQVMSVVGTEADGILGDFIGDVEKWVEIKARPLIVEAIKRLTGSIPVPATPVADPAPVTAPADNVSTPVVEQPAPVDQASAPVAESTKK